MPKANTYKILVVSDARFFGRRSGVPSVAVLGWSYFTSIIFIFENFCPHAFAQFSQ